MQPSRLLRGTFILSSAIFFTKFLGLIFVIPLKALVGDSGMALYTYAYIPYTIILSLSTFGVPTAIAKFVSKYNANGDYTTSRKLLSVGLWGMGLTGAASFLLLYFLAPEMASMVIAKGAKTGNRLDSVIMVIRLVSTALLIVPMMSVIRGYFQGLHSMGPTAISEVAEQTSRILFALIGAIVVLFVLGGSVSTAVGCAAFAAFIGALAGFAVLISVLVKRKPYHQRMEGTPTSSQVPLQKMLSELGTYAIPFMITDLAIPLYLLVDQLTVNKTLISLGFKQVQAGTVFANLDQLSQKLIMIPVVLSTALAIALVPTITESYSTRKWRKMHEQMTQAFQIVLFLTIPAAAGLFVLAYPIYGSLYGIGNVGMGGHILRWGAPTALLFAIYGTSDAILQGGNRQKFAVFSMLVGLLLKLSLNKVLLALFHGPGAYLATDIGFMGSITLNLLAIRAFSHYRFNLITKRGLLILVFTACMVTSICLARAIFLGNNMIPKTYGHALLITIAGILIGGTCYSLLSYLSNLSGQIFGKRLMFRKNK